MADDVRVSQSSVPTDPSIATDNIAGRHFQVVKVAIGADGEARDVTDADGFPVKAAALPLPTGASTEATLAALKAAVDSLSATISALDAKVVACDTGNITGAVLANTGLAQPLTDAQLRAASVPTSDAATQAIVQAIAEMSEGVQLALIALLDKTPLPTRSDATRAVCYGDLNDTILGSSYNTFGVNSTSNPITGAQYFRTMEPWHFADMGAARLYSNITVS